MTIEEIYQFIAKSPTIYLCQEQAVCYVLSVLLQNDSYGSELINKLEREHPYYRLSDTILFIVLKFLEDEEFVTSYLKK